MARNIVIEMTGDEHRLFQSMQKILQQQNKMEAGMRRLSRASQKAGRDARSSFEAQAVGQLRNYAMGVLSIGTAYRLLAAEFRQMQEV